MIFFLLLLQHLHCLLLSVLVYCVVKSPIYVVLLLLWHIWFSPPCMAAQLPFDFLTPGIVRKYWWKPVLCDNERICCQSALDLSTFVVLYVSQDARKHKDKMHTHKHTFAFPLWLCRFPIFLGHSRFFLPVSACCLFIRQTICWSCVFFSARHPLGTLLHMAVLYQLSDACGTPSVSHCPLHRHEVCVFTPGSLSAWRQIMGRARGSPLFSSLLIIHLASWLAPLCDRQ